MAADRRVVRGARGCIVAGQEGCDVLNLAPELHMKAAPRHRANGVNPRGLADDRSVD